MAVPEVVAVNGQQLTLAPFRGSQPARRNSAARGHFLANRALAKTHRLAVDPSHLTPVLFGVPIEEKEYQRLNVLAALAKRWQIDWHDIESVIKILAKSISLRFPQ